MVAASKGFFNNSLYEKLDVFSVNILGSQTFSIFSIFIQAVQPMSKKKLHYGVRLTVDQLKYLRTVGKPSEWIRTAVDEKRKREQKNRMK